LVLQLTVAAQLTKEEEDAMGDEVEVRREDQDKINKFSRLHQHELSIEDELSTKNVRSPKRRSTPLQVTLQNTAPLTRLAERKGRARRHHDRAGACRRGGYRSVSPSKAKAAVPDTQG